MINDLELSQLLTAKFCHDLAGLLGAVSNSVDFIKEESTKAKAMNLLSTSSRQSVYRLQFYRYAYGIANSPGEANLEQIESLCNNFLYGSKSTLEFHKNYFNNPDLFICNNTGKMIMCFLEIATNALIQGGDIKVNIERTNKGKIIVITAAGPLVKIHTDKYKILQGQLAETQLNIYNIHYYYTYRLINLISASLQTKHTNDSVAYILNCDIS